MIRPSCFLDKQNSPDESEIETTVGERYELWQEVISSLESEYNSFSREWVFTGKKHGWSLHLKSKKRAIVYLTPLGNSFMAGFALGQKAVSAAHESSLPSHVLKMINDPPNIQRDEESVLRSGLMKMFCICWK